VLAVKTDVAGRKLYISTRVTLPACR
jgi:hypothetical protein